jgi:DNA mismatch repair protein MutS2
MRALEHEQRLAARERETLSEAEGRLRQREDALRQREEAFRRRANEELEAQVREARREIDEVMADLKARTSAIAAEAERHVVTTGQTGTARRDARAAVDDIAARLLDPDAASRRAEHAAEPASVGSPSGGTQTIDSAAPARIPAVGERVVVGGLGLEAIVTAVQDGTAELDVRGKRMRASIRDLRLVAPASTSPARVTVQVQLGDHSSGSDARGGSAADLNVIGCTVDEAIARTERFLDESLLTDQRVVRLIHGYGTGQLKRALTGFLHQHPLVARFATAPPEQGGGGVTVVELKD